MPKHKPLVYLAGPYTKPDPITNSRNAMAWGDCLWKTGEVVPFVPHLSIAWHLAMPRPLEYWYAYDLAVLEHCQAVFRFDRGESKGADAEVARANALLVPVFTEVGPLLDWARLVRRRA